jgi:hypothetical protein
VSVILAIALITGAVILGVVIVLVLGLLRSHAEILRALHELGISLDPDAPSGGAGRSSSERPENEAVRDGNDARDLDGLDASGRATHVAVAGVDRLTLVAFLSSGCLSCRGIWDALRDPATRLPGDARVVAVTKGPEAESESVVRELAGRDLTTVLSTQAWIDYGVPVAPYFVLVDGATSRIVGEGAAAQWSQVSQLMSQALADAGISTDRGRRTDSARRGGAAREAMVDTTLRDAGITPGHASLYPPPADPTPR